MMGYGLWLEFLVFLGLAAAAAVGAVLLALGPPAVRRGRPDGVAGRLEALVRPDAVPAGATGALRGLRRRTAVRPRRGDGRRLLEGLEPMLESLVASLRAGRSLAQALEETAAQCVGPMREVLDEVVTRQRAGMAVSDALAGFKGRWPVPELAYLSACLETHSRTGGDVTALLVNLGGVVRERRQLAGELRGRTSEARFSAVMLALLPLLMLAYILWSEPGQLEPLKQSAFGRMATAVAALLWLAGVAFVRGLIGSVVREVEGEAGP